MPEIPQTEAGRELLVFGDELFGTDIAAGLEKLRSRLLDLSSRNRLLNFKHPEGRTSRKQVRFVDTNPATVFRKLRGEEEYGFRPVPLPESSGGEMIPFDEFTSHPETYLDGEVRREVLVGSVARSRIRAEDRARAIGISTTYDLAESMVQGITIEMGGPGNELPVLHYAEDLEQILRSIAEVNLSAERESGITTLYLVFGMLEWYEDASSELGQLAPLVLLPVSLRRRSQAVRTAESGYALEWSGEDVEVNRTLRLMLKERFGVILPEFQEGETLDGYFEKVRAQLGGQSRWRIRHYLTLTNLSFHKLRMWEDLDPRNWPNNRLLEHPLVRDFFVGRAVESLNSVDHAIDELEVGRDLPPLIYDADSSQHSALVDALHGKSLVIEGPPGTGKSQTITNLIAAALDSGKSVLFVAEKTTALAVVRKKLDEAGLGDFCLSLGTGDGKGPEDAQFLSRTRDIAESLRQRIEKKGSYAMPVTLPQKRTILRDYRSRLNEYVRMVNQLYGACGRTIQQTIGIRENLYESLLARIGRTETIAELEGIRLVGAESMTLMQVEACQENAGIYEQSLQQMGDLRSVTEHPWFGLTRERLSLDEEQSIIDLLNRLVGVTNRLDDEINSFAFASDLPISGYEQSIQRLIDLAPLVPRIEPGMRTDLLRELANPLLRREVSQLGGWLTEYREGCAAISACFTRLPELNNENLERLKMACRLADDAGVDAISVTMLRRQMEWLASMADYVASAGELYATISRQFECELDYDLASVRALVKALVLLGEAPMKSLAVRERGLDREGLGATITRARQEAEHLRKLAANLATRVDRNLSPSVEMLGKYAVVCANAGPFRLVSRDFRQAQREWLGMVRQGHNRTTSQMARDYRDLLNYENALETFKSNPEYLQYLGPTFNGLNTPFTELDQVVKWYDRIRLILGTGSEAARLLSTALFNISTESLKSLIRFRNDEAEDSIDQFIGLFSQFDRTIAALPAAIQREGVTDLGWLARRLRDFAAQYDAIIAPFSEFGVETGEQIGSLGEVFDRLQRLNGLKELIEGRQDLAVVFGVQRIDPALEFGPIAAVIDFINEVEATSLPTEFRRWLYSDEIEMRVEGLQGATQRMQSLYDEYRMVREQFRELTGIDENDWYQPGLDTRVSVNDLGFFEVRRRAQRALKAKDELSLWLITRRARLLMIEQGFAPLARMIDEGLIPPDCLHDATMFIYHNSILHGAFRSNPMLAEFNGIHQDEIRRRFAALDQEVIGLTRREIASRIDDWHIPPGSSIGPVRNFTQLGLISHLVANRNSRLRIRQLVQNAGGALLALKPCFMMSPLAVAKYLPPDSIRFDLVIMDEASQLRPEDGLGAIARGSQLVVVGDRMQLPPTNFFNTLVRDEEDDGSGDDTQFAASEMESVLDIVSTRYQPIRQLKWHYRSRHESLIAFSNREFYQDHLTVFPSPAANHDDCGIQLRHIPEGVYEQNRNLHEATEVVRAALDHLVTRPTESLGIVGLNTAQRDLISELLDKALRNNPLAAEQYRLRQESGEDLFVKNLEMVQGDERDVIFISGTVGRDREGRFRLTSFGPLNNARYGHRRLNVLITRARRRIVFFSSIRSAEIQVGVNSSWGVRAMRDYLAYAESGALTRSRQAGQARNLPPDSKFEIAVANTLRRRGFEVVPQVGVAGYWIDIVVCDPRQPGSFLLGIECDGASYHSSRSARDRDRLRQSVLEGLGWNLHHIWSTDWFRSREQEISKVVDKVARLAKDRVR